MTANFASRIKQGDFVPAFCGGCGGSQNPLAQRLSRHFKWVVVNSIFHFSFVASSRIPPKHCHLSSKTMIPKADYNQIQVLISIGSTFT